MQTKKIIVNGKEMKVSEEKRMAEVLRLLKNFEKRIIELSVDLKIAIKKNTTSND